MLTPREKLLTEYSISTDHHRNFCRQFFALVKKKILVMIRNPLFFIVDLIFPVFLIYFSIHFSEGDFIQEDFPKRSLSAYEFPQG